MEPIDELSYPKDWYYLTSHPKGAIVNSSLNEEIAKKGLILSNANKYENFKTTAAKKALTEAASALRE